jgi:hypothetical protein
MRARNKNGLKLVEKGTAIQPVKTSVAAPDSQNVMLQELKDKRELLQRRFENNPNEIHLALELKIIDDKMAECNQQFRVDRTKLK